MDKINLLVNLREGFFQEPSLMPCFQRLESFAHVRKASCDKAEEILPHLQWADAVLMWSWPMLTPDMLVQCPNFKFSANIDIHQEGARILLARGIAVSAGRRGFSPAVSEMALTLILSALRKTPAHHAAMRQGTEKWAKQFPEAVDHEERQLTGRNIGLVGFGGVGQGLARLLAPFACDIRVHDPYLSPETTAKFNVQNVTIEELIAHSEILALCAAANAGTKHLFRSAAYSGFAKGERF